MKPEELNAMHMDDIIDNTDAIPVCKHCGGENVTHDAITEFDRENRCWTVRSILDNSDCEDCGGECTIVWRKP